MSEEVKTIIKKALSGESLEWEEIDRFDDWKFEHSSVDILNLLKEVGGAESEPICTHKNIASTNISPMRYSKRCEDCGKNLGVCDYTYTSDVYRSGLDEM